MFKLISNLLSPVTVVENRLPPGGEELLLTLRSGDFASIESALAVKDVDHRLALIDTLARAQKYRPMIAKWRAQQPSSYSAAIVWGFSDVHFAWTARGGAWQPQNYGEFQRRLEGAHAHLHSCTVTNPKDPAPWSMLMAVAMGRELGVDETTVFFKEAWRRSGPSRFVGAAAVRAFAPKWGAPAGTLESMVQAMSKSSPAGHRAHSILADAAIELVVYRSQATGKVQGGMFTMPDIAPLVSQAELLWHKSPARIPSPLDAGAHSALAYCHWQAGNTASASPHLKAMNSVFDQYPWGVEGNAAAAARQAIKACAV